MYTKYFNSRYSTTTSNFHYHITKVVIQHELHWSPTMLRQVRAVKLEWLCSFVVSAILAYYHAVNFSCSGIDTIIDKI